MDPIQLQLNYITPINKIHYIFHQSFLMKGPPHDCDYEKLDLVDNLSILLTLQIFFLYTQNHFMISKFWSKGDLILFLCYGFLIIIFFIYSMIINTNIMSSRLHNIILYLFTLLKPF